MVKSKISTKYQVVLPKEIRKSIPEIKPGSEVLIQKGYGNSIVIRVIDKSKLWVDRVSDSLDGSIYGPDPDKYISDLRDQWKRDLPN